MFNRVLNAPLMGHLKNTLLRKLKGKVTKKVTKNETREGVQAKKLCHLLKTLCVHFLYNLIFTFSFLSDRLRYYCTVSNNNNNNNNNNNPTGYLCL